MDLCGQQIRARRDLEQQRGQVLAPQRRLARLVRIEHERRVGLRAGLRSRKQALYSRPQRGRGFPVAHALQHVGLRHRVHGTTCGERDVRVRPVVAGGAGERLDKVRVAALGRRIRAGERVPRRLAQHLPRRMVEQAGRKGAAEAVRELVEHAQRLQPRCRRDSELGRRVEDRRDGLQRLLGRIMGKLGDEAAQRPRRADLRVERVLHLEGTDDPLPHGAAFPRCAAGGSAESSEDTGRAPTARQMTGTAMDGYNGRRALRP